MDFLTWLIITVVSMLLKPKPKLPNAQRYNVNEFEIPTASEDRPQVYGVGTFKVAGNVIWYGDYQAQAVTRKVRIDWFRRMDQIIGYRYKIGMWMTLATMPCDQLLEIRYGDRVIWSGTKNLSKSGVSFVDVDASWTTSEGQEVPEGIAGRFYFFNQAVAEGADVTPLTSVYLNSQLGAENVPAYPNTLHVVWAGPSENGRGFLSTGPNIQAITFSLRRLPDLSHVLQDDVYVDYPVAGKLSEPGVRDAVQALIAANKDVSGDANPAFVALELQTSRVAGVGPKLSPWAFKLGSYLRAAEVLKSENHGVSFGWESSQPLSDLLGDLQLQMHGQQEIHERTGQLQLKLLRENDAPVAVFNDSNIIEFTSFTRASMEEASNEITVPFIDRSMNWESRTLTAKNPAGVKAAGAVITRETSFVGVTRAELASLLATRELRAVATPLAQVQFSATVEPGTVLKPGDPVTVHHAPLGQTLRMRVLSARFANFQNRQRVELECIEDLFRAGYASLAVDATLPSTGAEGPPGQPGDYQALTVPYYFTGDANGDHGLWYVLRSDMNPERQRYYQLGVFDGDVPLVESEAVYLNRPTGFRFAAKVQTSSTAGMDEGVMLTASVSPGNAYTIFENNGRDVVAAVGGLDVVEFVLVAASVASNAAGAATLQVKKRGLFGTVPSEWAAGTTLVLLYDYAVDEAPLQFEDYGGYGSVLVDKAAKPELYGPGGQLRIDGVSTPLHGHWAFSLGELYSTFAGRPYAPADVRLDGGRGGFTPETAAPLTSPAAQVDWNHRNRTLGGYSDYYTGDASAESGVQYQVSYYWKSVPGTPTEAQEGFGTSGPLDALTWALPADIPATGYLELELTVSAILNGNGSSVKSYFKREA